MRPGQNKNPRPSPPPRLCQDLVRFPVGRPDDVGAATRLETCQKVGVACRVSLDGDRRLSLYLHLHLDPCLFLHLYLRYLYYLYLHLYPYLYIYIFRHVYISTYIYMYIHIHTYTYIYIHIHVYIDIYVIKTSSPKKGLLFRNLAESQKHGERSFAATQNSRAHWA